MKPAADALRHLETKIPRAESKGPSLSVRRMWKMFWRWKLYGQSYQRKVTATYADKTNGNEKMRK